MEESRVQDQPGIKTVAEGRRDNGGNGEKRKVGRKRREESQSLSFSHKILRDKINL